MQNSAVQNPPVLSPADPAMPRRGGVRDIAVAVFAADPLTRESAVAGLAGYPQVTALTTGWHQRATVLLFLVPALDGRVLVELERAYQRTAAPHPRAVLVADSAPPPLVLEAMRYGLAAILDRQSSDFSRIVGTLVGVGPGLPEPASAVRTRLLTQAAALGRGGPKPVGALDGGPLTALAARETAVLRLFADGLDTGEVARELHYSERTVKNIVQGIVRRYDLRNRTHAVASALRAGAL